MENGFLLFLLRRLGPGYFHTRERWKVVRVARASGVLVAAFRRDGLHEAGHISVAFTRADGAAEKFVLAERQNKKSRGARYPE